MSKILFGKTRLAGAAGGFLLLETMIGVAVFAVGVLTLARCVQFCLDAEALKQEEQLARLALENRMAEVAGGAVSVEEEPQSEKLEGRFQGITLVQWRTELKLVNENEEALDGLYAVTLRVLWKAPQGERTKELLFYVNDAQ